MDPADETEAHHLLEALWLHQQHAVVDRDLLAGLLGSPVAQARIAADRVRVMWDHGIGTGTGGR